MPTENELNSVLAQRATEYGTYPNNMYYISQLKNDIYFMVKTKDKKYFEITTDTYRSDTVFKYIRKYLSQKDNNIFLQTVEFAQIMLSLKAVRSLTAKGDAFKDCIVDFINYVNLTMEVIRNIKERYKLIDLEINIKFQEGTFNHRLNQQKIDPESITYLIDGKWKQSFVIPNEQYQKKGKEYADKQAVRNRS